MGLNYNTRQHIKGVGKDSPVVVSENGAKQSDSPYRSDLLPPQATLAVAKVLKDGAAKYGDDNWRGLTVRDLLNHALTHALAYLSGDTQDDHLEHFACRALMALETAIVCGQKYGLPEKVYRSQVVDDFPPPVPLYRPEPDRPKPVPRRKRIYVAGPISVGPLEQNIRQACEAGMELLKAGLAPLVPHLTCYMGQRICRWPVATRDFFKSIAITLTEGPIPEVTPAGAVPADWYATDLPWVAVSDAVLRLPGESTGADLEVGEANRLGIPVFLTVEDVLWWAKDQN